MVTVTSNINRAIADFKEYLKVTSKTFVDAVNVKLSDAVRAALKATGKADKSSMRRTLDDVSKSNPRMTVAEMLVVTMKRKEGAEIYVLEEETNKFKNSRYKSIGLAKAGWLPAIKILSAKLNRFFRSQAKVKDFFGGAKPATEGRSTVTGTAYNDVTGNPASSTIERFKEAGADAGLAKVANDIETYFENRLAKAAAKFNKG